MKKKEYRNLHLVLMHKWYEMIASGEKREEYRRITPYWCNRLLYPQPLGEDYWEEILKRGEELRETDYRDMPKLRSWQHLLIETDGLRPYTEVTFHDGYSGPTITFNIENITIGEGNPEWGAKTGTEYFKIKFK